MDIIDAAAEIEDINSPGLRLHPLYPKGSNTWAVDVSGNWRIIFRFENSDAYDSDYQDYHGKN